MAHLGSHVFSVKPTKQVGEQLALKGEKCALITVLIAVGIFIAIAWADWLIMVIRS